MVDIQGVGDLYTDPQIHTTAGSDYGDGNLGTRGMALFFHSHECNDICTSMGLTPFDLAVSELAERRKRLSSHRQLSAHEGLSRTVCRGLSKMCEEPDMEDVPGGDIIEFLRARTLSERSRSVASSDAGDHDMDAASIHSAASAHSPTPSASHPPISPHSDGGMSGSLWSVIEGEAAAGQPLEPPAVPPPPAAVLPSRRTRFDSELDSCDTSVFSGDAGGSLGASIRAEKCERDAYWQEMRKMSRPAGLANPDLKDFLEKVRAADKERQRQRRCRAEVLGKVHLDMTRYHELGRFLAANNPNNPNNAHNAASSHNGAAERRDSMSTGSEPDFDKAAAWFHLDMAAKCGLNEALLTCARIYLGMPHDILPDFTLEASDAEEQAEQEDQGLEYMTVAAENGDLGAAVFLGEAFRSGAPLGSEREKSFKEAVYWYEKALEILAEDEADHSDEAVSQFATEPKYQIQVPSSSSTPPPPFPHPVPRCRPTWRRCSPLGASAWRATP